MQVGDIVAPFSAPSTRGTFSLADHAGKPVVLFFYPKDNTSGCTLENKDFTAAAAEFEAAGAKLVGVSRDSVRSHENFCAKQGLTVELASDKDEAVCTQFGVIKEKKMCGRLCRGIERSTFLIGADGKVAREWRGVKVPGHVAEVLSAVKAL